MSMSKTGRITALSLPLIATLLVVFPGCGRAAAAPRAVPREPPSVGDAAPARRVSIEKILAVLEPNVADPAFRARAAEKLNTLSDRRLRLMAALSERVAVAGDRPADGIAIFVLTALLILS
jgi:hypothetical protein